MKRYRILKQKRGNKEMYTIQERSFFGWHYIAIPEEIGEQRLYFSTVEEAKDHVDVLKYNPKDNIVCYI